MPFSKTNGFVPPEKVEGPKQVNYLMLMVGAQGVGKYSLHHQLVYSVFPTIRDPFFDSESTELSWKSNANSGVSWRTNPVRMHVSRKSDKEGGDQFYPNTVTPLDIYRLNEADGMVLVYSIASRSSFEALQYFLDARARAEQGSKNKKIKIVALVGNMLDISKKQRSVLHIEGEELSYKLDCAFIECSARTQKGLDATKNAIIKAMDSQKDVIGRQLGKGKQELGSDRTKLRRNSSYNSGRSMEPVPIFRSDTNRSSNSYKRVEAVRVQQTMDSLVKPSFGTVQKGQVRSAKGSSKEKRTSDEQEKMSVPVKLPLVEEPKKPSTEVLQPPPVARSRSNPNPSEGKEKPKRETSRSKWWGGSSKDKDAKQNVRPDLQRAGKSLDASTSEKLKPRPRPEGISITPPGSVSTLATLFSYRPPSRKSKKTPPPSPGIRPSSAAQHLDEPTPYKPHKDTFDRLDPHPGTKVPWPESNTPSSRASMEIPQVSAVSSARESPTNGSNTPTPRASEASEAGSSVSKPFEYIPMPEGLRDLGFSRSPSPEEDKKRLALETKLLEEERRLLKEQMDRLAEGRKRMLERQKLEQERKRITEERRKIEEERKRIEDELKAMQEESDRIAREEEWWGESMAESSRKQEVALLLQEKSKVSPVPIRERPRSRSATGFRPPDEVLKFTHVRKVSKDDSFLEQPPRSESRMGFRSPPMSPPESPYLGAGQQGFESPARPLSTAEAVNFAGSMNFEDAAEVERDATVSPVVRPNSDIEQDLIVPRNSLDKFALSELEGNVPSSSAKSVQKQAVEIDDNQAVYNATVAPADILNHAERVERSSLERTSTSSSEPPSPAIGPVIGLPPPRGLVRSNAPAPPPPNILRSNGPGKILSPKRLLKSNGPPVKSTPPPLPSQQPQQSQKYTSNNYMVPASERSKNPRSGYDGYDSAQHIQQQSQSGRYPQIAPVKANSTERRQQQRDGEERQKRDVQNQHHQWAFGYAVRPTTLPPIFEQHDGSQTMGSNDPRAQFGRGGGSGRGTARASFGAGKFL